MQQATKGLLVSLVDLNAANFCEVPYDTLGIDRRANVRAVAQENVRTLIIDGGTALTVTACHGRKVLEHPNCILPGISTQLQALHEKCPALPLVTHEQLNNTSALTPTQQAMVNGVRQSLTSFLQPLVKEFDQVYFTGGDGALLHTWMGDSKITCVDYLLQKGVLQVLQESCTAQPTDVVVGLRLAKYFGAQLYRGIVVSCDGVDCRVCYDDGDAEDLSITDTMESLHLYGEEGESDEYRQAHPLVDFEQQRQQATNAAEKLQEFMQEKEESKDQEEKEGEDQEEDEGEEHGDEATQEVEADEEREDESDTVQPEPMSRQQSEVQTPSEKQSKRESPRKRRRHHSADDAAGPMSFLKRRFAKYFEDDNGQSALYFGTVTRFQKRFWQVVYDDGDEDENNKKELTAGLELYEKHKDEDTNQVPEHLYAMV